MLALQQQYKEKALSLDELKEIALSVGVKEFEWKEMMEDAEKNADLANRHVHFKNYHAAFETAQKTISINPFHLKAHLIAAESALKIYEADKKKDYIHYAHKHAEEVLKLSPNETRAFEIISQVKKFTKARKSGQQKLVFVATGVALLIGLLSMIIFIVTQPKPVDNSKIKFQLIELQENANAAWAQVENVMNRRDEMIPDLLIIAQNENINYKKTHQELEELKKKLPEVTDDERVLLQAQISEKTKELTALIAQNSSSSQIELVLIQIEGAYNRISVETKRYNEAVREYNTLYKMYSNDFPEFSEMPYYSQK